MIKPPGVPDSALSRIAGKMGLTAQQQELALGGPDPLILEGMARAFFVSAWASEWEYAEEKARELGYEGIEDAPSFMGAELMDIAPETPGEAYSFANKLYDEIEQINNVNLAGFVPPGEDEDFFDEKEFGHYLAMEIMGHGVGWNDDHEDHGLQLPSLAGEETDLAYDGDPYLLEMVTELDEEAGR